MVQEQTATHIFTCMDDTETVTVRAANVADADSGVMICANVLIQGRVKDIGARRVQVIPGLLEDTLTLARALARGSICSLVVADPIRINDAVYEETEKINGAAHLRFHKGNTRFWTFQDETYFIRIESP